MKSKNILYFTIKLASNIKKMFLCEAAAEERRTIRLYSFLSKRFEIGKYKFTIWRHFLSEKNNCFW